MSDFLKPGVSEEKYQTFSDNQKLIFDLITSKGGGVTIQEIESQTGIDYPTQFNIVQQLLGKGVALVGIGVGNWTERFLYSSYAEDHDKQIQKN